MSRSSRTKVFRVRSTMPLLRPRTHHLGQQLFALAGEEIAVVSARYSNETGTANRASYFLSHPKGNDLVGITVDHRGGHQDLAGLGKRVEVIGHQKTGGQ